MDFPSILSLKEMWIRQCIVLWPYPSILHLVTYVIFREINLQLDVKSGEKAE